MIHGQSDTKPSARAHSLLSLTPEGQALWMDCVLAWPFWSIGQSHVEDVGNNKLHGVIGANINLDSDWKGSPYGASLRFTGQSGDHVTVADPPVNWLDGTSKLSMEVLFKPTTLGAAGVNYGLVNKYRPSTGMRSWRLQLDGDEISFQTSNDGAGNEEQKTTNANLVIDTWYHLVVTFNSGAWKAYLNGVLLTTDGDFSTHTSIFAGTEPLKLGQRTTSGGSSDTPINGEFASLRVWNGRILSAEEALRLFQFKWEMYAWNPFIFPIADYFATGGAAGEWMLAGTVAAGAQALIIGGLQNGTSYDVRGRPKDKTGNKAAGNTPVAGTPVAGQDLPPGVLRPIAPPVLLPEGPWLGMS